MLGRQIVCPSCGASMLVAAPIDPTAEAIEDEDDILRFADEPRFDPSAPVLPVEPVVSDVAYAPAAMVAGPAGTPVELLYTERRTFWEELLRSPVYPIQSPSNAATMCILIFIAVLRDVMTFALGIRFGVITMYVSLLMLIVNVVILGWLAACFMNVVRDTGGGSDDLPSIRTEEGWWGDVFHPFFLFVGAFATAMFPALGLSLATAAGWLPERPATFLLIWFWIAAGLFLLPMFLLLFSLQTPSAVIRVDLIAITIARSVLPYLVIWILLLLIALFVGLRPLSSMLSVGPLQPLFQWLSSGYTIRLGTVVAQMYLLIVGMRCIGLYYRHFKHCFAFRFE
jgi:hypothetical protein